MPSEKQLQAELESEESQANADGEKAGGEQGAGDPGNSGGGTAGGGGTKTSHRRRKLPKKSTPRTKSQD